MNQRFSNFSKAAGPGIIFASMAIGVSHLVQSTRAGAEFGLLLIGFVILASLLKYPFFEYGSRYANVKGTSIIDGYKKLGKGALWLYFLITITSMFFVTGAVGFVTAGFFSNLFQIEFLQEWTLVILFSICVLILIIGKYTALDGIIKIIDIVMLISTIAAFSFAIWNGPGLTTSTFEPKELWNDAGIFFLLALMGWMPTALDLSAWNSLWTVERMKQTHYRPKLKEILFEFRLAYVITIALAIMFVTLGSYIFFGSGQELSNNNADFAHQVVTLYTNTIGQWSYLIIAASAFTAMFGTILAVFDGYSRSLQKTISLLNNEKFPFLSNPSMNKIYLIILATGSIIIIFQFGSNLRELIDFATVFSFVIAPAIAIFNLKLVTGKYLAKKFQPSLMLKILSYVGIIFLFCFAIIFLLSRF